MAHIRVQAEPFDMSAELTALTAGQTGIGGVGSFIGLVRGAPDGVTALGLEHYPGMTERALARLGAEAESRWALLGCRVIHRIGRLCPGDPIVLVLTAAAHRDAALQATGFLIDALKTGAPFWKYEELADGGIRWVDARTADHEAARRWSR